MARNLTEKESEVAVVIILAWLPTLRSLAISKIAAGAIMLQ